MAITATQQTEIRRMLGFAALGQPVSSNPTIASLFSVYRVLDPTSALEIRMNNLAQDEEVQVLGTESPFFASYGLAGVVPPCISWLNEDTGLTVSGFVPTIRILEGDIITGLRRFIQFAKADVVTFNPMEARARKALLNKYRYDLATLLVVPLDPDLLGSGKSTKRKGFRFV